MSASTGMHTITNGTADWSQDLEHTRQSTLLLGNTLGPASGMSTKDVLDIIIIDKYYRALDSTSGVVTKRGRMLKKFAW